jgi:hypothetical protein
VKVWAVNHSTESERDEGLKFSLSEFFSAKNLVGFFWYGSMMKIPLAQWV